MQAVAAAAAVPFTQLLALRSPPAGISTSARFSVPPCTSDWGVECDGELYSVDTLNGAISPIGGLFVAGGLAGASGLTDYNGHGQTYSIDPSDGSATLLATITDPTTYSFTVGPGGLYYLIDSSGNLDTLDGSFNLTTGPALAGSPNPNVLAFSPGVTGFTPEPASLGLLGAGIAGLVAFRKYLR